MKYICDKCKKPIPEHEWVNIFNPGTVKEEVLCDDCRKNKT